MVNTLQKRALTSRPYSYIDDLCDITRAYFVGGLTETLKKNVDDYLRYIAAGFEGDEQNRQIVTFTEMLVKMDANDVIDHVSKVCPYLDSPRKELVAVTRLLLWEPPDINGEHLAKRVKGNNANTIAAQYDEKIKALVQSYTSEDHSKAGPGASSLQPLVDWINITTTVFKENDELISDKLVYCMSRLVDAGGRGLLGRIYTSTDLTGNQKKLILQKYK
ncbi:hypothetical protein HOH87_01715 [bacterium]|nr:hypothetical protein [bacterium]